LFPDIRSPGNCPPGSDVQPIEFHNGNAKRGDEGFFDADLVQEETK